MSAEEEELERLRRLAERVDLEERIDQHSRRARHRSLKRLGALLAIVLIIGIVGDWYWRNIEADKLLSAAEFLGRGERPADACVACNTLLEAAAPDRMIFDSRTGTYGVRLGRSGPVREELANLYMAAAREIEVQSQQDLARLETIQAHASSVVIAPWHSAANRAKRRLLSETQRAEEEWRRLRQQNSTYVASLAAADSAFIVRVPSLRLSEETLRALDQSVPPEDIFDMEHRIDRLRSQ